MQIAALLSGEKSQRLEAAASGLHDVRALKSLEQFATVVQQGRIDVAVLDPETASQLSSQRLPFISQPWRLTLTSVPVVLYVRASSEALRDLWDLRLLPTVVGLVIYDLDDSIVNLRSALQTALASSLGRRILETCSDRLSKLNDSTANAIQLVLAHPLRFHSVADVASTAMVSRRSLDRQLANCKLCTSAELVRIAHVVGAYQIMRTEKNPAKSIAARLGYSRYDRLALDVHRITSMPVGVMK